MAMPPGDPSQAFVRERFQAYYRREGVVLPERFGRREWGFIPFGGGIIQRHLGFSSKKELVDYLVTRVPLHAYHSTAYYLRPGAPTMPEKGWLGADLIFDLDADHIVGSKDMSYPKMLAAVKERLIWLHDEFLAGDLNFGEKDMSIVFSGARGYHIHVRDSRVQELESHERREIVDHIVGTGIDLDRLVWEEPIDLKGGGKYEKVLKSARIPDELAPGWEGRFTRVLLQYLRDLAAKPEEEATKELEALKGVGPARAREILAVARDPIRRERIRGGYIEQTKALTLAMAMPVLEKASGLAKGETDEPVTSDIKRLIRLMGSLHGKTGMRVTPLGRNALEGFDPLRDAFPQTFSEEPVKVLVQKPIAIDIRGEAFKLEQGPNQIPEYVAIFLICRGVATLA